MKRTGHKTARHIKQGAAAVLVLAALALSLPVLSPVLQRAALAAAVLSMPEGSIAALEARFRDLTEPPPESFPAPSGQPLPALPELEYGDDRHLTSSQAPPVSTPEPLPAVQPEIPAQYKGTVQAADLSGYSGGPYIELAHGWMRNYTDYSAGDLKTILQTPMKMKLENTGGPQVLIYHTHATESFCPYDSEVYDKRYNWRSTDNNNNMVAVGAVMAEELRRLGIETVQDTGQHDYPSYNGSYANSYRSVKDYLAQYPGIKVVLDLHRDAIERDGGVIVKPTTIIDGQKYAQIMIISNCDDGSGLIPHWRENLRFAAALTDRMERNNPGLTRPIMVAYRRYNQQLSTGALLLEFGSHANTIEEAKRSAVLVAQSLAEVLRETQNRT